MAVALRVQGGFAHCYHFTYKARGLMLAGKVVAKASLDKERAKQKVRGVAGARAVCARAPGALRGCGCVLDVGLGWCEVWEAWGSGEVSGCVRSCWLRSACTEL